MIDKIEVYFKKADAMRYSTAGDYFLKDGVLVFEIVDTGVEFYNHLVLTHEMVECFLAMANKIPEQAIMDFDVRFEQERAEGKHGPHDEPGDDKNAPYRRIHKFAENIERLICSFQDSDFDTYNEWLNWKVDGADAEGNILELPKTV